MPHDLYGNYYESERDAMNAEYAQMAVIDAGLAERNSRESAMTMDLLMRMVDELNQRVQVLEELAGLLK